ncbi:phenylalanine--tRNA ligase subunit beta [Mucisphaera sp.]|uniref:phenylalanine--tRNA ligase subunit beta n=1 Tax=Mucisphaera sp. TaxID=2913024 RepID=UPI003D1505BE
MKISLNWLNTCLSRAVDAQEAENLLTNHGFPIEETEQVGDDLMLDVEVTSNRGDCLSHLGVAREITAGSDRNLVLPEIETPTDPDAPAPVKVTVDNPDACPLYTARIIRGVKIAPSPEWLRQRLETLGLRPINNIVDITNYVLMETGQPLHAFDLQKLTGPEINVRAAKEGESFKAIDGSEHKLKNTMLVIADAERPCAIAGVMGGLDSEVTDDTTDILLESAIFEPLTVRATSRALKLASDSSFRFERRVDPLGVDIASRRAADLILQLAGGQLEPGVTSIGQPNTEPTTLALRPQRCRDLLGIDPSNQQQADLLARLAFEPQIDGDTIRCTIPTYRFDLTREVDLIEEIARLHGMENIPQTDKIALVARAPQHEVLARKTLADMLQGAGFHETVTPSLLEPEQAEAFLEANARTISLVGQRRTDRALRPSLLPSLLNCRKINQDHGNHDVRLFETAAVWWMTDQGKQEHRRLAMLIDAEDASAALRELKGVIAELVQALAGVKATSLSFTDFQSDRLDPAASVQLAGDHLGHFGLINARTADTFNLQTPVALAEIDLDTLLALYPPAYSAAVPPRLPGIERDLSLIVDETLPWAEIQKVIDQAAPARMERLDFVGVYRGKPIPKGRKSVTLRLAFRDPNQTLRHDAVDNEMNTVIDALTTEVKAEIRA